MTLLTSGTVVGPYTIVRRIASGGMGEVYLARHSSLSRHSALKVLLPHLLGDAEMVQRLDREARAIAALKHPHIIEIYDADLRREPYFLAMEYHARGSLESMLAALRTERRRVPVLEALHVTACLADALAYSHAQGFVHRDIKPSNVMLADDGRPVLTDFGVVASKFSTRLTGTQTALGTPAYMAPEQIKGESADPRSDLYSLGVMLYEMLAGEVPFRAESPYAVMYKQVSEAPPPIRGFRLDLPDDVCRLVDRLLSKRPEDRFGDAHELHGALRQVMVDAPDTLDDAAVLIQPSGALPVRSLRAVIRQLEDNRDTGPEPRPDRTPHAHEDAKSSAAANDAPRSYARALRGGLAVLGLAAAVGLTLGGASIFSAFTDDGSATPTPQPTPALEPTSIAVSVAALPATIAPTHTPTTAPATPSATPTASPTNSPTPSPTHTATATAVPPSATPTPRPTRRPPTATSRPPSATPQPPPTTTSTPLPAPTDAPTQPPPPPPPPPTEAPQPEPTRTTAPP